jgi:hypothetical protein
VTDGESLPATQEQLANDSRPKLPPPIIELSPEQMNRFKIWVDQYVEDLISDQQQKQQDWADQEKAYRAESGPRVDKPYVGASNETIPAIAMSVDPIHARLETGIFKQDPVYTIKPLRKSFVKYRYALSDFFEYYQKHKLRLRQISSPRILEAAKLGTCIFKTVYDNQVSKIKTYDRDWNVVTRQEVSFRGPRVYGISIGDFLFPPLYQHVQDCPIVLERIRTTYDKLKVAEASGKITNVSKLENQETPNRTQLEQMRAEMTHHDTTRRYIDDIEVYEGWCDYDINGDGQPEHLVFTWHRETREFLQLRYNWYFHQRKPYTVIPYSVTNDSLYGLGLCEMVKPFQDLLTKWHRMATDNAYLANIRMFIVKRESGIESIPRLYSGRCFFVDDPTKDFIPFAASDTYPSTIVERQNIFGLLEKRTGLSDYLAGRESPIVGSRSTATATVALIQEGTKRVEQVLENFRNGYAEIGENCMHIWIQFGLDGIDDVVFGGEETGSLIREFFDEIAKPENVIGGLAFDLTATDAANNRPMVQQMQLQIIQVMMQYFEKVLAAGQGMIQAKQTIPELAMLIADVARAARQMFSDLLHKYDIPNPDDYLPDLDKYLNGPQQPIPGGAQGAEAGAPGFNDPSALLGLSSALAGPQVPSPARPGSGGAAALPVPLAGAV